MKMLSMSTIHRRGVHARGWALRGLGLLALAAGCTSVDTHATSASGSSASASTGSSGGNPLCIPGAQTACACVGGGQGAQVCNAQGNGYMPCQCEGGSTSASGSGGSASTSASGGGSASASASGSGGASSGNGASSSGGAGGTDPGTPVACKVPGTCLISIPIPTSTSSSAGLTTIVCPGGPDGTATPPRCILEVEAGSLVLSPGVAGSCGPASASGTIKMRLANLPVESNYVGVKFSYSFQLGTTCGSPVWIDVPVQVQGNGVASANGSVRFGCDPLAITSLSVDSNAIRDATTACSAGSLGVFVDLVKDTMASYFQSGAESLLLNIDRGRACLDVGDAGAYPAPQPCLSTPCAPGFACAGGDCGAGTCTCGACTP